MHFFSPRPNLLYIYFSIGLGVHEILQLILTKIIEGGGGETEFDRILPEFCPNLPKICPNLPEFLHRQNLEGGAGA